MDNAWTSRLPAALLFSVMCLVGMCALPPAVYFTLSAIAAAADGSDVPGPVLVIGLPLAAYPVALWLWLRARRPRSTGRAWILAALGLLLVTGTSVIPVALVGTALVEEWQETQPGGRGYQSPATPR